MALAPRSSRVSKVSSGSGKSYRDRMQLEKLPAKKFIELIALDDDPKVYIFVGPDTTAKPFPISKQILCSSSSYFATLLEKKAKKGSPQPLYLKDCDRDSFELLMQYFYTREIIVGHNPTNCTELITSYLGLAKIAHRFDLKDVVYLAFDEISLILQRKDNGINRCHIEMVFADDWPDTVRSEKDSSFKHLLAVAVFEKLLCHAVRRPRDQFGDPLEEALATVPGLGSEIAMIVLKRIGHGTHEISSLDAVYKVLRATAPVE